LRDFCFRVLTESLIVLLFFLIYDLLNIIFIICIRNVTFLIEGKIGILDFD